MKKLILVLLAIITGVNNYRAQTAANFSCNDCSGNLHDAFADLDAGKVLVLVWVMPCSNCINGALTAQTEVQTANNTNPNKVLFYLLDDYANTTCATLTGWANSNGISSAIVMSNSLAGMSAYGAAGMPKIVVLGGKSHSIFYNKNAPDFTATGIRDAIQAALAAAPNGITEQGLNQNQYTFYPNPCNQSLQVTSSNQFSNPVNIQIYNVCQQCVIELSHVDANNVEISTAALASGMYEVKITDGQQYWHHKLLVIH